MTVKELIDRLEREVDKERVVANGFDCFHSWRGDYSQVAYRPAANVSVQTMLTVAQDSLYATILGWKGGEYTVGERTDCYLTAGPREYRGDEDEFTTKRLERMLADDSDSTCPHGGHVWADEFSDGDTCHCGRWYLSQDSNGSFKITEER